MHGGHLRPQSRRHHLVELAQCTQRRFADARDAFRPRAVVEHLIHLARAIERGIDVIGYLHWSLLDNFEWAEGFRPRFGLYRVDFDHPEGPREPRPSAAIYARIVRANAIEPELAAEMGLAL